MPLEHSPSRDDAATDTASGSANAALAWSINEFVEISGLGRSYIYESIKRGELTARKAGRRTLILRAEGERFLQSLPAVEAA